MLTQARNLVLTESIWEKGFHVNKFEGADLPEYYVKKYHLLKNVIGQPTDIISGKQSHN